ILDARLCALLHLRLADRPGGVADVGEPGAEAPEAATRSGLAEGDVHPGSHLDLELFRYRFGHGKNRARPVGGDRSDHLRSIGAAAAAGEERSEEAQASSSLQYVQLSTLQEEV